MMNPIMICGVTGPTGSYLTSIALRLGYEVVGVSRSADVCDRSRLQKLGISHIPIDSCDYNDPMAITKLIIRYKPMCIVYLGGQSSVAASFERPMETLISSAIVVQNFVETIRTNSFNIRFIHASSSEIYGNRAHIGRANEMSSHSPLSPYAIGKSTASQIVKFYRDAYGLRCVNAFLSNHESVLRGKRFVLGKVREGIKMIKQGEESQLILGNIDISRDWGWAPDYSDALMRMITDKKDSDYIIATGESITLRQMVEEMFRLSDLQPRIHLKVSSIVRPLELKESLLDPSHIEESLGWCANVKGLEVASKLMEEALW